MYVCVGAQVLHACVCVCGGVLRNKYMRDTPHVHHCSCECEHVQV